MTQPNFSFRNRQSFIVAVLIVSAVMAIKAHHSAAAPARERVAEVLDVAEVWAGHPVGFALLTHSNKQFVAFYDADRHMTVGERLLNSTEWHFERLPEKVGWDSHNSITMVVDAAGRIHLSGNMHCNPLVYFRTTQALDVRAFERVKNMIGERESRVTYPKFMFGPGGELIFTYRDGGSGNGDQLFNVYDTRTQTWRRLLDEPLTSGEGKMNAYFVGPTRGPDGYFHLCWVWRDTPDCATNHDLTYARSKDLVHWEKSSGEPLALPITLAKAEVVDPVLARGGIINGNTRIGFDTKSRVIITYHKFDEAGKTQLYNARFEDGAWKIYQTSDWDYRWEFSGGGSIVFEIGFGVVTRDKAGRLTQTYSHRHHGSGTWVLDEETLRPVQKPQPARAATTPAPATKTAAGANVVQEAKLQSRSASDLGQSGEAMTRYVLRWETLPSNRDKPRPGPLPPPSKLRLYKMTSAEPEK